MDTQSVLGSALPSGESCDSSVSDEGKERAANQSQPVPRTGLTGAGTLRKRPLPVPGRRQRRDTCGSPPFRSAGAPLQPPSLTVISKRFPAYRTVRPDRPGPSAREISYLR
jgi:hypothetical protein